ncbi:hypothetical protein B0O80DRAFT_176062 [Mortierella sp. GBAus27b]|nr:hypothetical protein BGX31_008703 [Mortierella sp. GBA43]KAI8348732.1 hypothetical protein B0O80DRAFT_176062 [Mortierella sp. GBAus27b]
MRHLRHYHTLAIVAVFALSVSLLSTSSTDAWPLREHSLQSAQLIDENTFNAVLPLQKRQATKPQPKPDPDPSIPEEPTKTTAAPPKETTSRAPATTDPPRTTTQAPPVVPKPTTNPPVVHTTTTAAQNKPETTSRSSSASVNVVASSRGPGALPTGSSSGSPGGDNGEGVPTEVSQKVLIGLGTVGGLIVFAMGGFAFCRHRRKKNLAKALLQQTAQFNNNNPYAKLSEPNTPAKESLPMTPTRPLGSCTAVSAYIPNLADEIEIGMGDTLTILQEYDDGWCFGANNTRNGIQGVFPRVVFEHQGGNAQDGPGYYPPDQGFKPMANKRMSSIPPGGWNNGPPPHNGGGGYGNVPPQHQGQNFYNQGGY